MKTLMLCGLITCLTLAGCGQRETDQQTADFMAIGQGPETNEDTFASDRVSVEPRKPVAHIVSRRGNATFRIINNGTTPLAVAKIDTSCSTCRIINTIPRKIPAGGSIDVEVRIAVGLLESLPSKRFVRVLLITPDNQAIKGLVKVHLEN